MVSLKTENKTVKVYINLKSSISNLLYLDVSINILTGGIPDEVEKLKLLYSLDVSNNNLRGSFSANISKMMNLHQLFSIMI
jgi:hypothetical protein